MAGRTADEVNASAGGTPAQERELRARGRRTMAKLLEAGRRVFARRGYHAARVDDIVRSARTSHGTFYLYFADKQDLLVALASECRAALGELSDGLGPITADEAGYRTLRDFVEGFLDISERYGPVLRAWSEGTVEGSGGSRTGGHAFDEVEAALRERIRDAGADAAGGVAPDRAAAALVAMLDRFSSLAAFRDIVATRSDPAIDTLARVAHRGFFGAKDVNRRGRSGV